MKNTFKVTIESNDSNQEFQHSQLIDVMDKSKVGRPKVHEEDTKLISVKLKISNYEHARTVGGVYGGYTGYINYLIEQDIRNRKVNK